VSYVELPSDHKFSHFLARMTPSKVFKDRSAMFSTEEKQLNRFLFSKTQLEQEKAEEIKTALRLWREAA